MGVMASFQDVVNFHHCIVQRVDQILELKELQEQMKEAHIQLTRRVDDCEAAHLQLAQRILLLESCEKIFEGAAAGCIVQKR